VNRYIPVKLILVVSSTNHLILKLFRRVGLKRDQTTNLLDEAFISQKQVSAYYENETTIRWNTTEE